MKTITLSDLFSGEEIVVKEIDGSTYTTSSDGHSWI